MNENPALPEDDAKIVKRFLQVFSDKEKALNQAFGKKSEIAGLDDVQHNQDELLAGLVEIQRSVLQQMQALGFFDTVFVEANLDLNASHPKPTEAGWSYAGIGMVEKKQAEVLRQIIKITGFKPRIQDLPVSEDRRNQAA